MHPVIYLNKSMVEATKARVAPVSSAMLYGRGVFTTLAIYNSQPFLWSKHWQRLAAHAIILARSGSDIWKTRMPGAKKTDLLIMTGEPQKIASTGVSLAVSPYRTNTVSPLVGIKSLNYLEHVLSWEEAQSRDFDEAVVLNERGEIVSATTANLFWAKNGTLHTPALSTGALAGITRECVIELANQRFIPLLEGSYEMQDLTEADEIFLTSSSLGVAPVTTFDFRRYSSEGRITTTIVHAFDQLSRG